MAALLSGASLGFASGISPGPLTALVVTRTLEVGFSGGLRVAIAPLLTDAPIVIISLLLFSVLPPLLEMGLTIFGGLFLGYLGIETMRSARRAELATLAVAPQNASTDIWRGVLVNTLSPHPWLFWISVGGPTLTRIWTQGPLHALAFLLGFYGLLVGSKVLLALAIAHGRRYLTDRWYQRILLASGLLLIVFGALLLWRVAAPA
ncbi:MAG: LysE family translocator [Caldilineaceae bacterium]|nr:LysE family translocator [Caldilineaceae bacterium]